jgi:superfamily I DNA and/or RNA helicase
LQHIWASFFLVVPVVSSTFASFGRLFDGVGCQELGWVFIDEAGQATPQAAVGAVWRAKRAVLIGDPKQLKPVVPLPRQIIEILREREGLPHGWHPERNSAQVLADRATRYGALMDTDEDHPYWVGSPLRVHRRCRSPMFDVANQIAYGGLMVQGTTYHVADEKNFPCGSSAWIDVPATVSDGGHYIPAQGEAAVRLLQALASAYDGAAPPVYVITPFKDVAGKFQTRIGGRGGMPWNWVNRSVGTIHTFQGKETDFVIILLGGAQEVPGARQWAAEEPNMLNVALTRAKKAVYVVGDHRHWSVLPNFSELARWLPRISGAAFDGRPSATITELHHRRPPAS